MPQPVQILCGLITRDASAPIGAPRLAVDYVLTEPILGHVDGRVSLPVDTALSDTEIEALFREQVAVFVQAQTGGIPFTTADVRGCRL